VVATDVTARPQAATDGGVPTALDLADQLLHLATGDRLLEDLRTLAQVNELIEGGATQVNRQGRPFRKVPRLVATPAGPGDLAGLIADALDRGPGRLLGRLTGLLSRITGVPGASGPDLVTFLLFLSAFTRRAVELGRRRADDVLDGPGGGWQE
jgi:hypothetical protein